jgi:hypothetical protein
MKTVGQKVSQIQEVRGNESLGLMTLKKGCDGRVVYPGGDIFCIPLGSE